MTETFVLITPAHCLTNKEYLAVEYSKLGVENARNLVGRIANLWFRYQRIEKSLADWEKNRREVSNNLARSGSSGFAYEADDRPALLDDLKRARAQRDEWHYKAHLFEDVDKLFSTLPILYVPELDLLEARRKHVVRLMSVYNRRKNLRRLKRRQRARGRSQKR
jgi:hypothetical protein